MLAISLAALAHHLVAQLATSPWWVPNFTLVGLVLAVLRRPARWLGYSVVAGLWDLVWLVRSAPAFLVTMVAIAWLVHRVAERWDVQDPRVPWVTVAVASAVQIATQLWWGELWSWSIIGYASVHVAMTTVMAIPAQNLIQRL